MPVDAATVKKIASLARIAITDEEVAKIAPELDNILGWIEQLGEVDCTGVEPMTAVIANTLACATMSSPMAARCGAGQRPQAEHGFHRAQGDRIMTDITDLGVRELRDGSVPAPAREVADSFIVAVSRPRRSTLSWSKRPTSDRGGQGSDAGAAETPAAGRRADRHEGFVRQARSLGGEPHPNQPTTTAENGGSARRGKVNMASSRWLVDETRIRQRSPCLMAHACAGGSSEQLAHARRAGATAPTPARSAPPRFRH